MSDIKPWMRRAAEESAMGTSTRDIIERAIAAHAPPDLYEALDGCVSRLEGFHNLAMLDGLSEFVIGRRALDLHRSWLQHEEGNPK